MSCSERVISDREILIALLTSPALESGGQLKPSDSKKTDSEKRVEEAAEPAKQALISTKTVTSLRSLCSKISPKMLTEAQFVSTLQKELLSVLKEFPTFDSQNASYCSNLNTASKNALQFVVDLKTRFKDTCSEQKTAAVAPKYIQKINRKAAENIQRIEKIKASIKAGNSEKTKSLAEEFDRSISKCIAEINDPAKNQTLNS